MISLVIFKFITKSPMMMNGKKKGTQLLSALSYIKLIYNVMRCIRHWVKIPERQLSIIWGCDWDLELCERKRSVEGGTGGGGGGVVGVTRLSSEAPVRLCFVYWDHTDRAVRTKHNRMTNRYRGRASPAGQTTTVNLN